MQPANCDQTHAFYLCFMFVFRAQGARYAASLQVYREQACPRESEGLAPTQAKAVRPEAFLRAKPLYGQNLRILNCSSCCLRSLLFFVCFAFGFSLLARRARSYIKQIIAHQSPP
jgi:hypothetical protein